MDDDRQRLNEAIAALEATRRVRRAMTTLVAARHAKQIDRRLINATIDATPYARAGLLDAPSADRPARLRMHTERDGYPELVIGGIPIDSPLASGHTITRVQSGAETDLFPLHFGMIGNGIVVPLNQDGNAPAHTYLYADGYDASIPLDEAERAVADLANVAALSRANAALLAERDTMILQARELARSDPLTGLPNRMALVERLDNELGRLRRHDAPFTLAIVDVDFFKRINDTMGHAAGDEALIRFAKALESCARDTDVVVRFAGDEFAIILAETTETDADIPMQRVLDAIRTVSITQDDVTLPLSASIGYAQALPDDDNGSIFKRADAALYRAKENGRNQAVPASTVLKSGTPA